MNKLIKLIPLIAIAFTLYACGEQSVAQTDKESKVLEQINYKEQHRPQFHFTPKEMWMNDPNGMVFYEGEYHLFYQHHPESNVWGPMHWGHAVSKDLTHWEHLPIALYPDSLGMIFSGSTVVDWKNTSGLGKNGQPPLVAIFTYHNMDGEKAGRTDFQFQGIAYSTDKGRNWTKYEGNPVIPNTEKIKDFRDPKVVWDEASSQWIMVFAAHDHVKFWGSKDLKKWEHLSDWGKDFGGHLGVWECPDLFPINVDGTGEKKWVLLQSLNPGAPNGGSGTQYFVGNFDGKNFTLDATFAPAVKNGNGVWLDYGRDNYAGVTWSDVPKTDGRRLFMGWMSNWDYATLVPTEVWRSATTLPRELVLKNTSNGYRIFSQPARELNTLRAATYKLENTEINGSLELTDKLAFSPVQSELMLEFELIEGNNADFGIELSNAKGEIYRIGYNVANNQFYSDRTKAGDAAFSDKFASKITVAPRSSTDKKIQFHVFFDVASAELFTDGGATVITDIYFPSEDFNKVKLYSENGKTQLIKGEGYQLKSIWQ